MRELRDWVKIKPEFGGGDPATVDGLHHLHCLARVSFPYKISCLNADMFQNVIRQTLWWNFDYYKAKNEWVFKDVTGEFDNLVAKYHVCKQRHWLNPPQIHKMCMMTDRVEL